MDKTTILREAVAAPSKKPDGKWLCTIATPGQGSSGFYSEELLRTQGPNALAPGAQCFINHDPDRNPRDMLGVFEDGAFWDDEKGVLRAELTVFPHWREFTEAVGPHSGLSIYFHGKADEDGNVVELTPLPSNGADLVARPGLAGSGFDEKLYENLRAEAHARAEESENMEKLEKMMGDLTTLVSEFVASQSAAKEGDEVTPEQMVAEALDKFQEAVAEIDKAELLPSQVEDIRARAKAGEDVAPLIETAKKINKELKEQFEAAQKANDEGVGNVLGSLKVESATELGRVFG